MELTRQGDLVEKSVEIADKLFEGTQFANDSESTELVAEVKKDFEVILSTDAGRSFVKNVEKLGQKVTTEGKFLDTIKIIFRIVQQLSSSPMVKLGLFLLGIGALIAVVGSLSFVAEGALAAWILRLVLWVGGALTSAALPMIIGGIVKFRRNIAAFWERPALPATPAKYEEFVLVGRDLETFTE